MPNLRESKGHKFIDHGGSREMGFPSSSRQIESSRLSSRTDRKRQSAVRTQPRYVNQVGCAENRRQRALCHRGGPRPPPRTFRRHSQTARRASRWSFHLLWLRLWAESRERTATARRPQCRENKRFSGCRRVMGAFGGRRLDAATLETIGRRRFDSPLDGASFSAHPKCGPDGDVWNSRARIRCRSVFMGP